MAIQEDRRRITLRLTVLQVACVVVFASLGISFWLLQIVENAKYEEMAENNHQRTLALRAPRGVLYDRNGQVLVENRHSFTISIVREHTKDLDRTIQMLSAVAGLDPNEVRAVVARHRSEPSYRPVVIVDDASLAQVAAITARRLELTIDYDLQKAVEDGFRASRDARLTNAGAAVVLDPNSGDVLAFSSDPAYDPNAFAAGIDRATWASLNNDQQRPLNDRALQGRYSPGSTFKMAVALAGLEEGVITPDFKVNCSGGASFYGHYFKCWRKGGHGAIDLRHAIEQSCDVYFYTVANMLGVDKINKWATLLGLGVKSGIDLPNEVEGLVPSTEWKRLHTKGQKSYAGETISVGIWQCAVAVTPVSIV